MADSSFSELNRTTSSSTVDSVNMKHQINSRQQAPTQSDPSAPKSTVAYDEEVVAAADMAKHDGEEPFVPMSPRRTVEEMEQLGRAARQEMRKHAEALEKSLMSTFERINIVREEHDKLESHNMFLQKYIGDLMSTAKITATSSRPKK